MIENWRTLLACSADPITTVIHDDGSLTSADIDQIENNLPDSRVLRKKVADELMNERLAAHDNARAFRRAQVWGIKLLDVALAEPGDCYYVDADIRWFRPFQGLFNRGAIAGGSVFLRDTVWTAYSIRPWHLSRALDRRGLRVVEGINTGLTLIDRGEFDLDFVDWFLAQPDWRVIPAWIEPTCWAALARRSRARAPDTAQLLNLYPGASVTPDTVGAHFLSAYRHLFKTEYSVAPRSGEAPVPVRLQELGDCRPWELGRNQLRRKMTNTLAQFRRK